jgi:hypothetical protein
MSLSIVFSGSALGAGSSTGVVSEYSLGRSDIFVFSIAGTKKTPPACDGAKRYAILLSNDGGRAVKDGIIAANKCQPFCSR